MIELKYGNTNTFFIPGTPGGLLVDTDYAGTLLQFYKAVKAHGLQVKDIAYVLATHYHPDHMGLVGELMKQGVKLLLMDVQKEYVHFSDTIFERDKAPFTPVDEKKAVVISCAESRTFLRGIGIGGEIVPTPSHSPDGISLVLDSGNCIVGDLEPYEYLEIDPENGALRRDWERILSFGPRQVFFAHRPEKNLE